MRTAMADRLMPASDGRIMMCVMMAILAVALTGVALADAGESIANPLADLARLHEGESQRESTHAPTHDSNADAREPVPPGGTIVAFDVDGPGVINHIWTTFRDAFVGPGLDYANQSEVVLRVYYDNREKPDIEAPVGDFFGGGFGMRAEMNSIPMIVENGVAMNSYWPMPFRQHCKITFTNESERPFIGLYYHIDWTKQESLPDDIAYFCAQYRQEFPAKLGHDYLILDAEGEGHYVGTVLSVRARSPQWFGEGDEKFYIDGATEPTIWGTGTEDYFCKAWGFRKGCFPYFGVTILTDWGIGQKMCMYRWHLADPVVFHKSLRFEIEHAGWIDGDETPNGKISGFQQREDDFATVAFWYQKQPTKQYTVLPSAKERKLPSIDIEFRGGDAIKTAMRGPGDAEAQTGWLWQGVGQLLYQANESDGAWLEIPFEVTKKDIRRLVLRLTTSYDFGEYQVYIDGKEYEGVLNLYSPETEVHEYQYGNWMFEPGKHTIKFVCTGKDPRSRGYWIGVDAVCLRERRPNTKWYGGAIEKPADWKE